MGDGVKKISFGFSKLSKKTTIVPSKISHVKQEENKIDFIDCVEGKSIKLKETEKCEDTVLVIPLKKKVESFEKKDEYSTCSAQSLDSTKNISDTDFANSTSSKVNCITPDQNNKANVESGVGHGTIHSERPNFETLDEIAAREILEDLNKKNEEEKRVFSVPLTSNAPAGEKESTLDDYENIPVNDFGIAMLRGMGWAPGKGIGKNEKLVMPSLPTLRPKGMGLGADKVLKVEDSFSSTTNEDLKMIKGSFVRIIAGQHKNSYGQIEGFDDESGRMIIKLTLKNVSVSLSEFMVQLVDKKEYSKNCKVINVAKYEQYKGSEIKKEVDLNEKKEGKGEDEKQVIHDTPNSKLIKSSKSSKISSKSKKYSDSSESSDVKEEKFSKVNKSTYYQKHRRGISESRSRSPENRPSCKRKKNPVSPSSKKSPTRKYERKSSFEDKRHKHTSRSSSSSGSTSDFSMRKDKKKNYFSKTNRSSSSSSARSSSSSRHNRKTYEFKKKKSKSHKYKSKSRSRSPSNHHRRHKKLKKSSKYS